MIDPQKLIETISADIKTMRSELRDDYKQIIRKIDSVEKKLYEHDRKISVLEMTAVNQDKDVAALCDRIKEVKNGMQKSTDLWEETSQITKIKQTELTLKQKIIWGILVTLAYGLFTALINVLMIKFK